MFFKSSLLFERIRNLSKRKKTEKQAKSSEKQIWFDRGLILAQNKEYEEAISCFNKDLMFNKPTFETLYEKGMALYYLKKPIDAVECFNKAWEIKCEYYLMLNAKAKSMINHKKFERSVLAYDEANSIKAPDEKFWHFKGLALHQCQKFDEAITCYDMILNRDNNIEVAYDKAKSLIMIDKKDNAIDLLKNICKTNPEIRKKIQLDPVFEDLQNLQELKT